MGLISRMMRQKAVYWKQTGMADAFGKRQFDDPVEIRCRWEDRSDEFVDSYAEREISNAVVYVDRDVKYGDYLWQGTLEAFLALNVDNPNKPGEIDLAYEIKKPEKLPNLKATEFLRTVYL